MDYILALDQGTTSSRAILFDRAGQVAALAQQEFKQHFPQPGWVEHDAQEIWTSQLAVARECIKKMALAQAGHTQAALNIVAIGITNQRETTVLWDRQTGQPVAPAIVWQDRRTAGRCDQLRARGHAARIQQKTGLVLDAYFSGTKLEWLLDHVPGARARAERGELAFGTVDSWLIWNLTGGRVHATDASNASRTLLFNLHTLQWDDELLALFDIPRSVLPQVLPSSGVLGETEAALFGAPIRIAGRGGRPAGRHLRPGLLCARHGQKYLRHRLLHADEHRQCGRAEPQPAADHRGMVWPIEPPPREGEGWGGGGRQAVAEPSRACYALEGSVFMAGATIQWLRDGLQMIALGRRGGGAGRQRARHRRCLPGAGLRRPGRARLGRPCARHARRHDARHHPCPHCAGRS